jgi:hypothetical protein
MADYQTAEYLLENRIGKSLNRFLSYSNDDLSRSKLDTLTLINYRKNLTDLYGGELPLRIRVLLEKLKNNPTFENIFDINKQLRHDSLSGKISQEKALYILTFPERAMKEIFKAEMTPTPQQAQAILFLAQFKYEQLKKIIGEIVDEYLKKKEKEEKIETLGKEEKEKKEKENLLKEIKKKEKELFKNIIISIFYPIEQAQKEKGGNLNLPPDSKKIFEKELKPHLDFWYNKILAAK